MEPSLSSELLTRTLNFHGQQLHKLWEAERGETYLPKLNVDAKALDFGVFQERQKHLSFQDRGKRLKLQQFIVKKASALYDTAMMEGINDPRERSVADDAYYAVMPPYENFLELDKQSKTKHFFQVVKVGDVVMCSILSKTPAGMMLRVLCTDGDVPRHVADLNIKALCPLPNIIPAVDKKAVSRNYLNSDTVCCEVLEIYADTDKLVVGMKGTTLEPGSIFKDRLGLIHSDDLPEVYKKAQEMKGESYEKMLERSLGFSNPNNISYLSNILGLGQNHLTYVRGMRGRFPEPEYATELRQVQASKWAFKSVADGIEHFKLGRHSEAFQCLNKALNIDPRNVEGLVARGALFANSGSFTKAIDDFENALKLNQNHQNARKYMGETLVALGRSFEDENKFEDAFKSYDKCLTVIPFHEEAQNSIEFLKSKISKLSDVENVIPGLTPSKTLEVKETLKQLLKVEVEDEKDKEKERSRSKKKKDRKSRKRRRRSSTSSSSSSSGSSHSSSESSSSSSDSSSGSSQHKKHRKSSRSKKDKSLSPLSKRMALMDPSRGDAEGLTGLIAQRMSHYNPPALPFAFTRSAASYPEPDNKACETDDYEQRVFRFLEQTKGDSEYEEKVRKFLEESARWKKERKSVDEKSGKKKKKKDKKSREKDKGKKKKDHDKKKRHKNKRGDKFDVKDFEEQMGSKKFRDALRKELVAKDDFKKRKGMDDEDEFLYGHGGDKKDLRLLGLDNLPDLDDLETKLSAYYAKVEKGTGLKGSSIDKMDERYQEHYTNHRNEERHEKKRHAMSPGKGKHISPKVMFVHHDDEEDDDDDEDDRVVHIRDKKKMDIFAESPSGMQDSKSKFGAAEAATLMNSKWKMQIGSVGSKLKKREKSKFDPEPWEDVDDKRFIFIKDDNSKPDSDEELQKRRKKLLEEKVQARKAALLEASEKRNLEKQKKEEKREEQAKKPQTFTDKFQGGFRSISSKLAEKKLEDLPPLPPGMPPKIQFPLRAKPTLGEGGKGPRTDTDSDRSEVDKKKKLEEEKRRQQQAGRESGGSSRSRSRSRGKYSRHSSSSGSAARRRSRSGSYRYSRSRSRSYGRYRSSSRSYRSRSRSYGSRSRSRSEEYRRRSRSPRHHAGKYQGRYPRARGTYYRPRFNTYKNPRGFQQRGGRGFRGRRPFVHRGRGRGNYNNNRGGRFFHYNNKPGGGYHDRRRHDRPRSRESRSYSREEDDPMRKVDAAKERIDKYLATSEEKKDEGAGGSGRKDDPLSEGEERDDEDYPPNYVDRKLFEGKWADKDAPPESSIEEIDKFLTKVKAQKKEEMKERNKSFLKTDPR